MELIRSQVAIVGGGPTGLLLSHLLAGLGIESLVVDHRTRADIETTVRAGILEAGSVALLRSCGLSAGVDRDGERHNGIQLRFAGGGTRVDLAGLTGHAVWLYPQTELFAELADVRQRDGGDVRFGVSDVEPVNATGSEPGFSFVDADGVRCLVRADFVVGADGSRSRLRAELPQAARRSYLKTYPYAWLGLLVEAPKSSHELVYAHSPRGFALVSQRTDTLQRMYLQCSPDDHVDAWSDARIWDELQARVAGSDGFRLQEGAIQQKSVLLFRSFVSEPMRYGRLLLAGDAAHTVPPTGAKGLNLAIGDAAVLAPLLAKAVLSRDPSLLDAYGPRALARVWRMQAYSNWLTTVLHVPPDASPFDVRRQEAELTSLVDSEAGIRYLAEGYVGWPEHPA